MDCCGSHRAHGENDTKHENHEKHNGRESGRESSESNNLKGGQIMKMDKKVVLWIVIGVMLVLLLYLTFFKGGASASQVGNVASSVQSVGSAAPSYGGMVGGC